LFLLKQKRYTTLLEKTVQKSLLHITFSIETNDNKTIGPYNNGQQNDVVFRNGGQCRQNGGARCQYWACQ